MATLKIYDDSKNYTATVVKLSNPFPLPGLDKLQGVSVFGNTCIVPKDYDLTKLYVFFPAETVLSKDYLKLNNLYRDSTLNANTAEKGYFDENGRVKAIKLKGNVSTGVVMPVSSLYILDTGSVLLGDEFNELNGVFICRKYIVPARTQGKPNNSPSRILDQVVDKKQFPEHIDTDHLEKNILKVQIGSNIFVSIKLHGTSARVGNVLTKRKLKWHEKLAKKLKVQVTEEEYQYVVGSRRTVKSVAFNALKNKQHYYSEDLWTRVADEFFKGKLHKGEMVYFEIIGKNYDGSEIQKGYSYGLKRPEVFVYRITNINPSGVEVDLPFRAMETRTAELGLNTVPVIYEGPVSNYLRRFANFEPSESLADWRGVLIDDLKDKFMNRPSILDNSIIEEGICLRVERYPRPFTLKMKSPLFLLHEGKMADALIEDVETQN